MSNSKVQKYYTAVQISLLLAAIIFLIATASPTVDTRVITVIGNSMAPTIEDGETVEYTESFDAEKLSSGDIVIFKTDKDNVFHVKRIVGVGGDGVEIFNNVTSINNVDYPTKSVNHVPSKFIYQKQFYVNVGEVFVLGDNYNDSIDSREYGCISVDKIIGIVKE